MSAISVILSIYTLSQLSLLQLHALAQADSSQASFSANGLMLQLIPRFCFRQIPLFLRP